MESFSLLFREFGHQMDSIGSRVDFLVIWGWKSCQNRRLGCAKTIVKTMVFIRFHFFKLFTMFVSSGDVLDLILVPFWSPGSSF